jgi:hypothetical protein
LPSLADKGAEELKEAKKRADRDDGCRNCSGDRLSAAYWATGGDGVKDDEGDLRDCGAGQRHMLSLRG